MNLQRNLKWRLIIPLAVLALIRPLLSMMGIYRNLPGILEPVLATALIVMIWISVVLARKVPNPVITLAATGGVYGIFVPLLQQFMWNFVLEKAPATPPPIAYISIIVTETLWGATVGLIAIGVRRLLFRREPTGLVQISS
jgi:hypothetical protein